MHAVEYHDGSGNLLAIRVSPLEWEERGLDGAMFLTAPEQEMQLGLIHHRPGHVVPAHWHPPQERTVRGTSEVLVVHKGRVRVTLFSDGYEYQSFFLGEDDVCVLVSGGHMLEVVEDAFLWEIKTGPYNGMKADKIHFTPRAVPEEKGGADAAAPQAGG